MTVNKKFIVKNVGNFSMVIDTSNPDSVIKLNSTAAEILDCIANGKTEDEIAKELMSEYDITSDKAVADVESTVIRLKELGIVE